MPYEALALAFEDGDVLYGLNEPRATALNALGRARTVHVGRVVLGCIPWGEVEKTNVLIQNDITNAVWDPLHAGRYSSSRHIRRTISDGNRGVAFRQFLRSHDRYDVASLGLGPGDGVRGWTKTSKAGLEFHARTNRTVHFIITDIAFGDVASKTRYGAKGNITSAELRWLFRHRQTPEVKNFVRFWTEDREFSHAEVFDDPAWSTYNPKQTYGDFGGSNAIRRLLNGAKL